MPPNDNESVYYGDAGRGGGGGGGDNGSAVIPNIYVVSASPSIVSGMSYGGGGGGIGGGNNSNSGGDVAVIEMISSNSNNNNNNNANSYNNGGHGSHHHSSSSSAGGGGGGGISGNSSSASSSAYSQSQLYVGNPYMMMNNEPGGYNVNAMMHYGNNGGGGTEAYSIAGSSAFGGGGGSGLGSGMMSRSGSQSGRSLANSAALVPRAKFSWASESVGPQSTIFSRKSYGYTGIAGEGGDGGGNSVPEPNHDREGSKVVAGRIWASFAWIITFPIPNKCVMRPTKDAKQAWREKVALFVIMVSCSVFFVGVFGFVPLLICYEDTIFSLQDIWLQTGESWVVVHGWIYDVDDLINRHPGGVKGVVDYLGKDASRLFPRLPPVYLPEKCLDMAKVDAFDLNVYTPFNNFTNPTCQSFSELDILLGITCHTFMAGSKNTSKFIGDYTLASGELGVLSHTTVGLQGSGIDFIIMYDRVYDVTNYVKAIRENQEPTTDEDEGKKLDNNPQAYLTSTLNKVIMNSLGTDATELYEALFGSVEYIQCLEELFYVGVLDDEFDTFCYMLNMMMYSMIIFVALLMVIQFLASMVYICPRHRTYSEEDVVSPVMIMVPCYNEGDNELRKTIKSVLNTTYPDENKGELHIVDCRSISCVQIYSHFSHFLSLTLSIVLFMVADGLVTGNGEDMSTPEHLANILGFDIDEFEDDTFEYDCIGVVHTKNRARVYHGILQKGHKFLKYIAVVKCGLPEEATTSAKPGNRGKRDSQLVIMGYYNRIHYGRNLTELDSAIQRAMVDLNLQADMVRFMMAIDADTRVDTMSITHMVYGMDKKEKVLALCGETKVDNKASSWVTMIQVFEYYNSHHLKKAFEAAFGCVTCLPGCFTMYRIIADDGTPLLPGDGVLYEYSRNDIETLHEKNLYHLGEDRMLTTLLLKYYPDRSLTFIPEAACWTIVPHTFRILLSQRRRWINSTVHNMFELLKVDTMCGVCCISMKVVVFIDLIATMILPASYIYAMYLIFLVMFEDLPVSVVLVILYGIIMGIQVVVFILRSRWEYGKLTLHVIRLYVKFSSIYPSHQLTL
jgi:chitin synthase